MNNDAAAQTTDTDLIAAFAAAGTTFITPGDTDALDAAVTDNTDGLALFDHVTVLGLPGEPVRRIVAVLTPTHATIGNSAGRYTTYLRTRLVRLDPTA